MTKVVDLRAQDQDSVLFICDFSPPRGPDTGLLRPAGRLDADFISVAYNPGRSTRVSSPLAAFWIKANTPRDVVFSLATRDMNKVATQSLLLGASMMGLENVVVVKGDDFTESEFESVKSVNDYTPTGLIASITSMNEGLDFRGRKLRSPTDLCVGATIDLGTDIDRQLRLTRKKVESGAQFFLLQALFYPQRLGEFIDSYAEKYGAPPEAPVFCGVQVMTQDSIVFGDIPEWVTDGLEKGRSGADIAVQLLQEYVELGFNSIYLVPPVMRGGRRDYPAAQEVIEAFRS